MVPPRSWVVRVHLHQAYADDETRDAFQGPWEVVGDQDTGAVRVLTLLQRHTALHNEQRLPLFRVGFHSGRGRRLTKGAFRRCLYLITFLLASIHIAIMFRLTGSYRLLSDLGGDKKISHSYVTKLSNFSTQTPQATVKDWDDRNGRWDRFLIGIFSYDSPNEYELRVANRETHLSYQKQFVSDGNRTRFTICSLHELLNNSSIASDGNRCQIVYTFVMGGGIRYDNLQKKFGRGLNLDAVDRGVKTRCLWQDPECGGSDIRQWTVRNPKFDVSPHLQDEIKKNKDITFLSISENHELGKTDTWFTYAAMLTKRHPSLNIRFIAKMDSDNFLNYVAFLAFFNSPEQFIRGKKYLYGGYVIYRAVCSGRAYGYLCRQPEFTAPLFMAGALAYLSTPLAQHVFMDGTTLESKNQTWIPREDVQLGNMVYSDPSISVELLNHHHNGGRNINTHCFNDPVRYRREYYKTMGNTSYAEPGG
eukprot:CCRYP_014820-RA/>CCRYP_014820-RA protein AED:0.14 eAED:-0.18 QI:0/-1/0/1/-1/1/1/0/475